LESYLKANFKAFGASHTGSNNYLTTQLKMPRANALNVKMKQTVMFKKYFSDVSAPDLC
jgi:hypothetical protein